MQQVRFQVPEMHCAACEKSIHGVLNPIAGVHTVAVDVAARQVQVEFEEGQTTPVILRQAIERAGFDVE